MAVDSGFDRDEFDRWLQQARHTLSSAERDLQAGDYAWSCFKSQQAGEYAAKAVLRGYGRLAAGHSILRLLEDMKKGGLEVDTTSVAHARLLDRHYIPPRCPDAYPGGSPFEFYDEQTARQALEAARSLLAWLEGMGETR
ncbi:MAG: HEPN domain-containing protein [Firmicutes bacterium]|nr:HEPN domain-containing protein [Bacillota bacterium]